MQLWIKIGIPIGLLTVFATMGLLLMSQPLPAAGMAVLGVLTVGFTRWSLAPLDDVTKIIEGIAAGDLRHASVDRKRTDEIGRLARSTNQMLAQLNELSGMAERLARGDIQVDDVEEKVLKSGRLRDADIKATQNSGDLEANFIRMANQMRRLTIQARVIARDDLNSPLLDERIPGDLGDAFGLMVRNLRTIAERAKDIAEGDLTTYVDGDGDLTTAFNQMVTGLNDLIQRIVETALQISTASEEILLVLQDQELAASHQASGVEETQRTMETLLASARKIAENSQTVFKSAEKTQANNRTVANRIGELKSHTARIAEILEVIKSIADRSDLLALNASLEGMRAGEAGKGFTLVAAEMRRLAENIKDSVGDIKDLVSDIRESSLATVMATEQGSRLSERTTDTALQISLITQQQQSGTEQVTQSMEELSHLINQGVSGTRQVTTAATELANSSEMLRGLVNKFEVVNQDRVQEAPASRPSMARVSRKSLRDFVFDSSIDSIDPKATLNLSKQFAMRARKHHSTPVDSSFDNLPAAELRDSAEPDKVDTKETPGKNDPMGPPTVEFSSAASKNDELFDQIAGLASGSSDVSVDSSGEFDAIARDIESSEIELEGDDEDAQNK